MNKGNSEKVMAEAVEIVRRLAKSKASIKSLGKEYHCGYATIKRAIDSQLTKAQWQRISKKKMADGGAKTRFPKGCVPWNKGTHYRPGKGAEKTQFKKGHLPENHRHIGTIRIVNRNRDGRITQHREIKISGIMQGKHIWITYAKYLWEKENGPVPTGHFIVHADGDLLNDSPGNFRLVDRKKNLMLMLGRDGNLKKCRKRAARAARKRHAKTRKIKQREARVKAEMDERYRAERRQEAVERRAINKRLSKQHGEVKVVWECIGCGTDYDKEPPGVCPKCNGLRFSKIKIGPSKVLSA